MLLPLDIVYCCIALSGLMRNVVSAVEDLMNRPIVCRAHDRGQISAPSTDDNHGGPVAQANP